MSHSTNEKAVVVLGPVFGAFSTVCEVSDSPTGPEYKLFRFREGCKWHAAGNPVRKISVFEHWREDSVGECEGRYRVCSTLDTPSGFVALVEATTAPEVKTEAALRAVSAEALRCEDAIINALESEPRMPLRDLKRKTNAHRFGEQWDDCLQELADAGEIRLEEVPGTAGRTRTWVALASDSDVTGISQ
jgi:hypothetical protein